MTGFDIESSDLARFDRHMLADVGLVEGERPDSVQLRRRVARTSGFAALIGLLLGRGTLGTARHAG